MTTKKCFICEAPTENREWWSTPRQPWEAVVHPMCSACVEFLRRFRSLCAEVRKKR